MMNASEFVNKAVWIACDLKTLYVMGCIGAPMTAANKQRYIEHHEYNRRPGPKAAILAASDDTFGFDCVCLIKSILWNFAGDKTKTYGGAVYCSNGVPDIGADSIINVCSGVSTTFKASDMVPGELLWKTGHVGIYIGDGKAVECTPSWTNCVQITDVANILSTGDRPSRTWTKHGRLPYVVYDTLPFVDVKPSNWYYDAVATVYRNNIMVGTDSSHFSPNSTVTRAQMAQIITNLIERYHK